jgi:hypothetical protein
VAKYGELATAVGGAAFVLHSLLRPYGMSARAGAPFGVPVAEDVAG